MNGNYPVGAEFDLNAPFNQPEPAEITVECECQCILGGFAKVTTEDAEYYHDEDGSGYDLSQCNLKRDYEDTFLTPRQLITRLYNIELERVCNNTADSNSKLVMKSCEVWMECGTEDISVNEC